MGCDRIFARPAGDHDLVGAALGALDARQERRVRPGSADVAVPITWPVGEIRVTVTRHADEVTGMTTTARVCCGSIVRS